VVARPCTSPPSRLEPRLGWFREARIRQSTIRCEFSAAARSSSRSRRRRLTKSTTGSPYRPPQRLLDDLVHHPAPIPAPRSHTHTETAASLRQAFARCASFAKGAVPAPGTTRRVLATLAQWSVVESWSVCQRSVNPRTGALTTDLLTTDTSPVRPGSGSIVTERSPAESP